MEEAGDVVRNRGGQVNLLHKLNDKHPVDQDFSCDIHRFSPLIVVALPAHRKITVWSGSRPTSPPVLGVGYREADLYV
jgi:hypothetical protein